MPEELRELSHPTADAALTHVIFNSQQKMKKSQNKNLSFMQMDTNSVKCTSRHIFTVMYLWEGFGECDPYVLNVLAGERNRSFCKTGKGDFNLLRNYSAHLNASCGV